MAWVYLVVGGLFEIGWALGFKALTHGGRWWLYALTGLGMIASFGGLWLALRAIPVGTAYAIWTGIGAAGTAALGMLLFHEPVSPARLAFLALILIGLVGLKVVS